MTILEAPMTTICPVSELTAGRGVAALVDGRPIAVFLLDDGSVHAIDNVDPGSGAGVLSRGVVGEVDGGPTVASPMYKHRFDLRTGRCLDDGTISVAVHRATCRDGLVSVRIAG